MNPFRDIRITDPDTRAIVERIRRSRGRSTASGTARDLIRERAMQLGVLETQCAPEPEEKATTKLQEAPCVTRKKVK